MLQNENKNCDTLSPTQIVELILNEESSTPCDETTVNLKLRNELPEWFDELKFKRGQRFFHENIFGMLFAKLCGLLTILTVTSAVKILIFTNKSNTPLRAYKRYMATISHMCVWYNKDWRPGSNLWHSIKYVRNKHFAISRITATKCNLNRITQSQMALAQFGFVAYILVKPEMVAIHNATNEDLEGFVHVWKTIGYLLGIDDRFNICQGSVAETKEICSLLIKQYFAIRLKEADDNFKHLSYVLVDGMRVFNPFLNYAACMAYIHDLCDISKSSDILHMNFYEKCVYNMLHMCTYACQFYIFRKYMNFLIHMSFYFIIYVVPLLRHSKFRFK